MGGNEVIEEIVAIDVVDDNIDSRIKSALYNLIGDLIDVMTVNLFHTIQFDC